MTHHRPATVHPTPGQGIIRTRSSDRFPRNQPTRKPECPTYRPSSMTYNQEPAFPLTPGSFEETTRRPGSDPQVHPSPRTNTRQGGRILGRNPRPVRPLAPRRQILLLDPIIRRDHASSPRIGRPDAAPKSRDAPPHCVTISPKRPPKYSIGNWRKAFPMAAFRRPSPRTGPALGKSRFAPAPSLTWAPAETAGPPIAHPTWPRHDLSAGGSGTLMTGASRPQ
jgi:hypothetical protein